jgi:serine/threonine protein kinase
MLYRRVDPSSMKRLRGTISAPSHDHAWVTEDGPVRGDKRRFLVRYSNCTTSVDANNPLLAGEKVVFHPADFGSDGPGAVEVVRLSLLPLEGLVELADSLLHKGDRVDGQHSAYLLRKSLSNRGAAGMVWEAEDLRDHVTVALKFFAPSNKIVSYGQVANACERFMREAVQGPKLNHKNIVRYLDSGQHPVGLPFVCMEFCYGGTLADEIKQGVMPLKKTLLVVSQIAEALQYLHSRHVIHRDVKPHNILRRGNGSWCLGDLGIIQLGDPLDIAGSSDRLTRTNPRLGSWQYMAPEQCDDPANVTELADVYSLGVSWYELLTGEAPSREHIAAGKVTSPVSSSPLLSNLLMRMLHYEPEGRVPLSRVLSVLRAHSPFDVSEVEEVVRSGLYDQHHPDVPRATVSVTSRILTRLGLSPMQARQYLSSHGYRKPPKFITEDGEFSREIGEDILDEMATWVADKIMDSASELQHQRASFL